MSRSGFFQVGGVSALVLSLLALVAWVQNGTPGTVAVPQAPINLLLFYDMEGASGVLNDSTMNAKYPDAFERGRRSLIEDVNAVVAGLFDGGAAFVDVKSAHGYGDDSLVYREALDDRANIASNSAQLHPYLPREGWRQRGYTAVVTVAMHDKPLSGGFSPHTIGLGRSPIINGVAVTETELVGYAYGTGGLPVIFASGDDRLGSSLAVTMPWLEYVTVKRVTRPTVVEPLPREQTLERLRRGAEQAVRALRAGGRMRAMTLPESFRAGMLPTYPIYLPPGMGTLPGLDRSGDTVTFVAHNYEEAYRGFFVLQRISGALFRETLLESLLAKPGVEAAFQEVYDSIIARWTAFEAGTWKPQ